MDQVCWKDASCQTKNPKPYTLKPLMSIAAAAVAQARENLELSFVQEAEMVFTTLSGTGRRIFEQRDVRFETVLIDEAAQASELATLQAFAFGCRRCAPCTAPSPRSLSLHLTSAAYSHNNYFNMV